MYLMKLSFHSLNLKSSFKILIYYNLLPILKNTKCICYCKVIVLAYLAEFHVEFHGKPAIITVRELLVFHGI
jgi:hypothetical protein